MRETVLEERTEAALETVASTIRGCERAQVKFQPGTSQYSLLKNRLDALHIAQAALSGGSLADFPTEAVRAALTPIGSIISKCRKARSRTAAGTAQHTRLTKLLQAMELSTDLISRFIASAGMDACGR